ncbi:MAG: PfkB family carbohydrate kinase [Gaiellales bacterium]
MQRVAIVGNLGLDVVSGAPERPGGAVWYCGHALARLGPELDVRLVCRCAEADAPAILPELEALGFPVAWRAAEQTIRFSFHYEGDRRVMSIDALADPWTPADVTEWVGAAVTGADWVLVGALNRGDFPLETLAALARDGHRLILDAQGLVRRAQTGPLTVDGDLDHAIFDHITALKLNDEEAIELCGSTETAALLGLGVPEVILTLGSQGADIVYAGQTTHVPAVPVDGPVDPTGAGDMFLTAYTVARLRGDDPGAAGLAAAGFVSTIIAR